MSMLYAVTDLLCSSDSWGTCWKSEQFLGWSLGTNVDISLPSCHWRPGCTVCSTAWNLILTSFFFCLGKPSSMPDMAAITDKGTKKLLILWIGGSEGRSPSSTSTDRHIRNESCKHGNGNMSHLTQRRTWPKMFSPGNVSSLLFPDKKERGLESQLCDV